VSSEKSPSGWVAVHLPVRRNVQDLRGSNSFDPCSGAQRPEDNLHRACRKVHSWLAMAFNSWFARLEFDNIGKCWLQIQVDQIMLLLSASCSG